MKVAIILCLFLFASPVLSGTLIDDFEDGDLDGWRQLWPQGAMIWKSLDGELECSQRSQWSAELVIGELSWKDYTIECDVRLLQDHGAGDVDLFARITAPDNGYGFLVGDWQGRAEAFVQRLPEIAIKKREPFDPLEMDVWHHLKLEAEGNKFVFWINDEKAIEYQDEKYQSGMPGLGLANYTARFDNVIISGSDVPDTIPTTWEGQPVESEEKLATCWGAIKL